MTSHLFPHEWYEPVPGARALRPSAPLYLFIAPHPDDDVIGAGGMMALLGRARRSVAAVYVTDGARPGRSRARVARQRRREAREALRRVHARCAFFLPFTSRDVHEKPARVRAALWSVLDATQPRALYLPCPFEQHVTHRAVTRMVMAGLRRMECGPLEIWGYGVWSPLPPSELVRTVDITGVAGSKRAAIGCHVSQLAAKDFAGGILGLNRFAAVFSSPRPDRKHVRYAEQFLDLRASRYGATTGGGQLSGRVYVQGTPRQGRGTVG